MELITDVRNKLILNNFYSYKTLQNVKIEMINDRSVLRGILRGAESKPSSKDHHHPHPHISTPHPVPTLTYPSFSHCSPLHSSPLPPHLGYFQLEVCGNIGGKSWGGLGSQSCFREESEITFVANNFLNKSQPIFSPGTSL